MELEKKILRRKTDRGTDVGISLDSGIHLHHGDVIGNEEIKILLEQTPEKVISVKLKKIRQFPYGFKTQDYEYMAGKFLLQFLQVKISLI